MFSKNNTATSTQVSEEQTKSVPSIVSADLHVNGNLTSKGEIQVDGTVHGDIQCKALIVGAKGAIKGEVTAQTVRMHGSIAGQIKAKSVFLASTARMSGDIHHESLAIEPGAFMEGLCKRIEEVQKPAAAPPSDKASGEADTKTQAPSAPANKPVAAAVNTPQPAAAAG